MITEYLKKIMTAIYGEEVRSSIHDAIEQCYHDATGHPESVAAVVRECEEMKETVDKTVEEVKNNVLNIMYPIGSIYTSIDSTDPSQLFGGTWERIKGKVLVGVDEDDDTFAEGVSGGQKLIPYTPRGTVEGHAITVNEMPAHTHTFTALTGYDEAKITQGSGPNCALPAKSSGTTASAGGSKSHTHPFTGTDELLPVLQPYTTCYMWMRIS